VTVRWDATGVSFLLPLFVLGLVKDKEERVLIMMKMVSHCDTHQSVIEPYSVH